MLRLPYFWSYFFLHIFCMQSLPENAHLSRVRFSSASNEKSPKRLKNRHFWGFSLGSGRRIRTLTYGVRGRFSED